MRKLFNRLDDATVRFEQMICLAGALASIDSYPDALSDLFDEEDDETLIGIFGKLPKYLLNAREEGGAEFFGECFTEWAVKTNHLGFLIQFATPVMKHHGSGSSYSWGFYSTKWVYGNTFDEAVDAGFAWVADRRLAEKKDEGASEADES